MNGRIKFQVWSDAQQRWKSCYVLIAKLHSNLLMMRAHGFKVRVRDQGISIWDGNSYSAD